MMTYRSDDCFTDYCIGRLVIFAKLRILAFPAFYGFVIANGDEALSVGREGYSTYDAVMSEERSLAFSLRKIPDSYFAVERAAQEGRQTTRVLTETGNAVAVSIQVSYERLGEYSV